MFVISTSLTKSNIVNGYEKNIEEADGFNSGILPWVFNTGCPRLSNSTNIMTCV